MLEVNLEQEILPCDDKYKNYTFTEIGLSTEQTH